MSRMIEARRFKYPNWLDRFELVATVTHGVHCANFIQKDQCFVFDLMGRIKPEKSTANLCLGILARLQPAILMAQDRASLGVHPVSAGYPTFDCFDTGIDHGGMGKVSVKMWLRDVKTGELVEDAAAHG